MTIQFNPLLIHLNLGLIEYTRAGGVSVLRVGKWERSRVGANVHWAPVGYYDE